MAVVLGVVCIIVGTGWALLAYFVEELAVRGVAGWISVGSPSWSFVPIALGIAAIVWG